MPNLTEQVKQVILRFIEEVILECRKKQVDIFGNDTMTIVEDNL